MARDRLAAMRAQQGQNHGDNSYPQQPARYDEGGRGYSGRDNYEMSQRGGYDSGERYDDYNNNGPQNGGGYGSGGGGGGGYAGDDMSAFYSEISSIQDQIKRFTDNVNRIGDLHSRSLNATDDETAARNAERLDQLVEDTRALSGELKVRIKNLERKVSSGANAAAKRNQTGLVKSKFMEAIQHYQKVEQEYRNKHKARMERQFRIVKPDASPEEVQAVVNDEDGGQVFAKALMNSNRYGESKAAYREVQERHEDIKRIEKTLVELAQLFNDMSVLVEQQGETIDHIETQAEQVNVDTEKALEHTNTAVEHARSARKKRWICFGIIVVILIIVAIVLAVVITNNKK